MQLLLILAIVLLDQCTKWLIREAFVLGESVPVWRDVFHLTYHHNTGAAFGLFEGRTSWLAALSLAFIAATLIYVLRHPAGFLSLALCMVLGGAIGNAIDRLFLGYVIDFIDLRVWPIFNVADSAITLGVLSILAGAIKRPKREKVTV